MTSESYKFIFACITMLVTSGCFGYINYNVLEKLGLVVDRPSTDADKKYKVILFTGVNIGLYWILTDVFSLNVTRSVLLVLFFDVVGTIVIIAPLIKLVDIIINLIRTKNGKSEIDKQATRDYIFNSNKDEAVFIYDFENKLIASGWLNYQQAADNNYFDLALVPFGTDVDDDYDNVKQVVTKDNDNSRIIVDFEKKVKIMIRYIEH
ncbi:hypothetical protein SN811_06040 [Ligilactobacillus agilis]|uniref:Lipoprotein n=1 Tax=Ligilactobacillus agilis TaxID=1601 RepID=A0A6F9Y3H2_9LACO|nr:hypothetical protein SN811_06040 [Ligilactobacillus agilis]